MRKVLLLCVALLLLLSQSVFAQQESQPEFDSVKAKKELAEKYADKMKKDLSAEELENRTRDVQRILNELAADVAAGKTTEKEAKIKLEKMDVYMLDVPKKKENEEVSILSSGTDITMNSVWITYDSATARWTVTGGGYWKNTNWWNDRPGGWWGYAGETKNMGGVDSVGITYYNTGGTYNTSVVSSLGYVTDHNGWSDYMENPSHGDGRYGVAFDFQDKMRLKNACGVCVVGDYTYYGSGFSASVTYNSNFVNYNGYARSMYAHTWNTTTINSIGFNGSGTGFGVTFGWSSESNKFPIFNGSDTTF
ncbi:hypothetical protein [Paenibacillus alkalitolerans]|uniref:hypothetical protein n=1 Tax=Paenibacillus alkalitolerans TaxID=2799335 RepID=UPI0018F73C0B|nr:hypothetical protein [Paenibacillus alkalitolerans]